jgi:hypothetical protein
MLEEGQGEYRRTNRLIFANQCAIQRQYRSVLRLHIMTVLPIVGYLHVSQVRQDCLERSLPAQPLSRSQKWYRQDHRLLETLPRQQAV